MTASPIHKVLSSMKAHQVQCLLMGGQACVLYGAAEFSRDIDFAILADSENLQRLRSALDELQASVIAVPPFDVQYLEMGLAVHFRCQHVEAVNLRIDVMTKMRNVDSFVDLWNRRTTIKLDDIEIDMLSLPDLVAAKKTQRDKDWPMITRLVESNFFANRDQPTTEQIQFWAREMRTPTLLLEVARRFPVECQSLAAERPLLQLAIAGMEDEVPAALAEEELREREADRKYWAPLRAELERLRQQK